ncbi:MAG: OmpH family outer membrane protein [Myxococcales bacterium]|nr:OmpH family outer membrane protein [Myxococcales bacterium]
MFRSLLIACFLLFPMVVKAETKRIGYVDLRKALNEVDDGRQAKNKLQKKKSAYQTKLNAQQEKLKREKKIFDRRASILRGEAKRKAQLKLQQKFLELQKTYTSLTRELAQEEAKETRVIFRKMELIIREIAEKEGLDLMLEKTESSILYARSGMDYTNELIRLYNKRFGRGGGRRVSRSKGKKSKKRRRRRRK